MKIAKLLLSVAALAAAVGAQDVPVDRRPLVCFLFDLTAMNDRKVFQAQENAIEYSAKWLTPSDPVAVMTFAGEVKVVQPFTSDGDALRAAIRKIAALPATNVPKSDLERLSDQLRALEEGARLLQVMPGAKRLVFYSSGPPTFWFGSFSQLGAHQFDGAPPASRANLIIYTVHPDGDVTDH
jgi:hypothetical protein